MSTIAYRPDIDGLRAIAVLSVVLCHMGIGAFSGGYVGVDVFFVISGYLITSLIVKDLENGTFSFAHFWERRCRRILPPLLLVMMACAVAGWFFLLPADYERLGQQIAAQAVFASNILFKTQAGYFDAASQTKPLLHTWSLAVEEQFYIVLPLALYGLWRYRRDKIGRYLAITAVITFIGAVFIMRNSPSSAFYLLPFRAWELLIGSLLAVRPPQRVWSARNNEILATGGLLAILLPIFFYHDDTPFPGWTALPPCLGAAAIILANTRGATNVGKLLSLRPMVFVGLVSYSFYLWHWPLIAFVRYNDTVPFTLMSAFTCGAVAFLLAILTWHFIEKPVRRRVFLQATRHAYMASLAGLLIITVVGGSLISLQGVPSRIAPEVVQLAAGIEDSNPHRVACDKPDFSRFDKNEICQANADSGKKPSFIVWGDSLADAIAPAFYEMAKNNNMNGYIVTAHGCPPILRYNQKFYLRFQCSEFNDRVLALIDDQKIKHVFIVGNLFNYLRPDNDNHAFDRMDWNAAYQEKYPHPNEAAFQYTLDELNKRGIKPFVIIDTPVSTFDPPRYLAMRHLYKAHYLPDTIDRRNHDKARQESLDLFLAKTDKNDFELIDPATVLCDAKNCRTHDNSHSLYYDRSHLSTYGARSLIPMLSPYFEKTKP